MSNRQLKRTEAEFFVYNPGAVVPYDVTHIIIHPSVKILPAEVFLGLVHLKEVVLPEGLRVIGRGAFYSCRPLEGIRFPPTLVRIGNWAFRDCTSLTTLRFPEGLVEISQGAFFACTSLTHVCLSSTVTMIRNRAFSGCSWLRVVILVDGIRTIGSEAFYQCALEGVVLPASLTEIGWRAFGYCRSLGMVKLSGGIQLIRGHAFGGCDSLNHVRVTPKSLVVTSIEDIEDEDDFDFEFSTDGTIIANTYSDRLVISSECFYSMKAAEVSAFEIAVTEILGMQLEWGEKHERLRGLLAVHERRRKEEAAGLLELGLRKADMHRSAETGPGTGEERPLMCEADVIGKNVMAFL